MKNTKNPNVSNSNVDLSFIIVDYTKDEHLWENSILAKFLRQFDRDKKEQLPDLDDSYLFHVEKTVRDIHRNGKHLWFISHNLNIIGYVTVLWNSWPIRKSVWISDFFIDKEYRGQGFGRIALNMIIGKLFEKYPDAERVGLSVFSNNKVAKALYSSMGFASQLETMVLEKKKMVSKI